MINPTINIFWWKKAQNVFFPRSLGICDTSFQRALPQNWRLTCMFATTETLLLELPCLNILSSLFDFFFFFVQRQ